MAGYGIGLDVGIASVGWAVAHLNAAEEPDGIIALGSRIFEAAEQPKTGASLAAPRRESRSARRRTRRRRHRKERIKSLLLSSGVLCPEELEDLFEGQLENIYVLRVRALDEKLTGRELARVLIHLAQRRGFKSNRIGEKSEEDGKLLKALSENKADMEKNHYRSVAEMLLKDERFAAHKRNRGGEYIATMGREQVVEEVHAIFAAQRRFGSALATEELEGRYVDILTSQRSFDEGPGQSNAREQHYGSFQALIGPCTLFGKEGEKRAAKATWSFEYFSLLDKLNNFRLVTAEGEYPLTAEQREKTIALLKKSDSPSYAQLRRELSLEESSHFNMVRPGKGQSYEEAEKKEKLNYLRSYHRIRKALDKVEKGRIEKLTWEKLDAIGEALTRYKTEENVRAELRKAGLDDQEAEALCNESFSGFGHLSVKACRLLIPHLEQGLQYSEACAAIGKDHRGHEGEEKQKLIRLADVDYESVTSPVVRRAVSQCLKVVNAIIRKQGESPVFIHIELAREMAQSKKERDKDSAENKKNQANNEAIIKELQENFHISRPGGQDIVKLKLWKEQDGQCAYSLTPIEYGRLLEQNYCEIDHIVPYSISFDDTYKNKVLVRAGENRNKGNRLPLQYLSGEKRERFLVWTSSKDHVPNPKKRELLLKEKISDEAEFRERHLQDTKTASVFLRNLFEDKLLFAPSVKGRKKRVTAVNGAVTDLLRKRWGIKKIREDGELHHAVDAVVVACTTDGMIQQLSRHYVYRECQYVQGADLSHAVDPQTGEVVSSFPYPWQGFRKELELRTFDNPLNFVEEFRKLPLYALGEIPIPRQGPFVSRMPNHKVTGAAHMETIRSPKAIEQGIVITKTKLSDLSLDKDGEIAGYYNPDSDRLTYEALRVRLAQYGGKGEKAFPPGYEFHKPKSDGSPGPLVKTVKIAKKTTLSVAVHDGRGRADNGSMVRIDVYRVEGDGYYFVPIYVADTLKKKLPNRAVVANKPYEKWKPMEEENFIFSLYPGNLLKASHKKSIKLTVRQADSSLQKNIERKEILLYYVNANISTGAITCTTHDNGYEVPGLGIKTLASLEKYEVDMLGEYHKVEKETRQRFPGQEA